MMNGVVWWRWLDTATAHTTIELFLELGLIALAEGK